MIERQSERASGRFSSGSRSAPASRCCSRRGRARRRDATSSVARGACVARRRTSANDVTNTVVDTFKDARRRVEDQIDSRATAIDVKRQQVHRAMEAGRAAAQEARDELEQRIAETKAAYSAGAAVARAGRATVQVDEMDEG